MCINVYHRMSFSVYDTLFCQLVIKTYIKNHMLTLKVKRDAC